jgi:hypothetical protein
MIHYHGLPITPAYRLLEMRGRHLCVSHYNPGQVKQAHDIAQSVMLDNGAYPQWKRGVPVNWPAFYAWADEWLDFPTTWAVIPDVIDGGTQLQDALVREWPFGSKGAPVWHMDEPISRALDLIEKWPRVCVGSTAEFAVVLSDEWRSRMDDLWSEIIRVFGRTPWLHMLRGMQLSGRHWPFASVDSTDIARNHNRPQNSIPAMVARWDAVQTPGRFMPRIEYDQPGVFDEVSSDLGVRPVHPGC